MLTTDFSRMCACAGILVLLGGSVHASTIPISPRDFERELQASLDRGQPGDVIELPAGNFAVHQSVRLTQPGIEIRGAGPAKTILHFDSQQTPGPGIEVTASQIKLSALAVVDSKKDGILVHGVESVTLAQVQVTWSRGRSAANGKYGIHLESVKGVVVRDSEAANASDTGVFVEQSEDVKVFGVNAHGNTVGIETENSSGIELTGNLATGNTGGIFASTIPDLPNQRGDRILIANNQIVENNARNLLPKTERGHVIPPGLGTLLLAVRDTEVTGNRYSKNEFIGIAIDHFAISGPTNSNPAFHPRPERLYIHHNVIDPARGIHLRPMQMSLLFNVLFGFHIPAIVDDGIEDGTYSGTARTPAERICIRHNVRSDGTPAPFGNAHLDHQRKGFPLPGGPVTRDLSPYDCGW